MNTLKSISSSKTVWLNAIAFILFILSLPQLGAIVPAGATPYIALITAILNGILRIFFTSQPLTATAAGRLG